MWGAVANFSAKTSRVVDDTLEELGLREKPRVLALNKVDLLGPGVERGLLASLDVKGYPAVLISAVTGHGLERLLATVERAVALLLRKAAVPPISQAARTG